MSTGVSSFYHKPDKDALVSQFVGKLISDLPTPSVVIDRSKFVKNSRKMLNSAENLGADFRCHIKTHKTVEGVNIQLGNSYSGETADRIDKFTTNKIIVSTLAEAWSMLPLIEEGKVSDILFGLPIAKLKIPEAYELTKKVADFRIMVDSAYQVDALVEFSKALSGNEAGKKWSVFIKIDMGYCRAGICEGTPAYQSLLQKLFSEEIQKYISVYGLYCHAGHSYGAEGSPDAEALLIQEVRHVNAAARQMREYNPEVGKLQLSVGATPTAHVSRDFLTFESLQAAVGEELVGNLELHAGNYPCCDLQQVSTGLVAEEDVSLSLLVEIIATYEGRNGKSPGEQLINAGSIALSREVSRFPGHGKVVLPTKYGPWIVGKTSQEHGILYPQENCTFIPYGEKILVMPQHACMTACAHAWYFVVEGKTVVDVWIPAKLW